MTEATQTVLKKLEDISTAGNPYWNISKEAGLYIRSLVEGEGCKSILELGTSNGYSAIYLALAAQKTGGEFISIDSHAGRILEAERNLKEAGLSQYVDLRKDHAPEVLRSLVVDFDFVFLDLIKMYYLDCVKTLLPHLKPGAMIVADNITSHAENLREYLDYMSNSTCFVSREVPLSGGLLVSTYRA